MYRELRVGSGRLWERKEEGGTACSWRSRRGGGNNDEVASTKHREARWMLSIASAPVCLVCRGALDAPRGLERELTDVEGGQREEGEKGTGTACSAVARL
jgi:hypothetical protein